MKIEYLADHEDSIPTLAGWAFEEWSYLHPERTLAEVEHLIPEGNNKGHIPISLVAIDKGELIGWVALKENDFKARPDLSPWLAGLYVDKPHRRKGVGTKLVHETETLAARLGASQLYLVTDDAELFYSNLCWGVKQRTVWQGHSVTVMEKDISRLG